MALSDSLAVWFDAVALSLGDPPPLGLRAGTLWDRCLELSATQRGPSHGGQEKKPCTSFLSFCPQRPIFHLSLLLWISSSERCACFTPSDSPQCSCFLCASPLTQALRSQCSKMGWVQSSKISAELLIYSNQTAFSFLTSWLMRSAPCMGISSIHFVHRSNLFIGAIER